MGGGFRAEAWTHLDAAAVRSPPTQKRLAVGPPLSCQRCWESKLHMVLTEDWDQPLPHEDWHGLDRQSEDVAETEKD